MKKHSALVVLQAMLVGIHTREFALPGEELPQTFRVGRPVEIDGRTWLLAEANGGGWVPCVVGTLQRGGLESQTLMGVPELSLQEFLAMCERMDEGDVFATGCGTVLMVEALERGQQRDRAAALRVLGQAGIQESEIQPTGAGTWVARAHGVAGYGEDAREAASALLRRLESAMAPAASGAEVEGMVAEPAC
jgi:hypothetical protein